MHPDTRTLVAYLDGELKAHESRKLARHLENCPQCRRETDAIEADMDWLLLLDAASGPVDAAVTPEGLEKVLDATRQWRQACARGETPESGCQRTALETHLRELLELYFGSQAVAAVQGGPGSRVSVAGQVAATESLVTAFLGRRAASVLMREIENRQRMELFQTRGAI